MEEITADRTVAEANRIQRDINRLRDYKKRRLMSKRGKEAIDNLIYILIVQMHKLEGHGETEW